jgi:hypothetical protein
MMQIGLIGIAAGAAAALLFASVASGVWLSIPLFYLAPLPILIAALGWSHWAALIAALAGAVALAAFFGPVFFFAFLAGAGVPAWWLGYLAMLARPTPNGSGDGAAALEWYPPGRLVCWAAILAALVVIVAIPNFGGDAASFRSALRDALIHILHVQPDVPAEAGASVTGIRNANGLVDFLVLAVPPAAAIVATITSLVNLWLAARIVKVSGRLQRPWPQLSAMTFPKSMAAVLAAAVILSFAGGMIGIVGAVLAAGLLMAFAVLGLAVLHAVTQGLSSRAFLLGGIYAALVVFGWPVLALCALGLVDIAFDLRSRIARRRGPPAHT